MIPKMRDARKSYFFFSSIRLTQTPLRYFSSFSQSCLCALDQLLEYDFCKEWWQQLLDLRCFRRWIKICIKNTYSSQIVSALVMCFDLPVPRYSSCQAWSPTIRFYFLHRISFVADTYVGIGKIFLHTFMDYVHVSAIKSAMQNRLKSVRTYSVSRQKTEHRKEKKRTTTRGC